MICVVEIMGGLWRLDCLKCQLLVLVMHQVVHFSNYKGETCGDLFEEESFVPSDHFMR